MDTIIHTGKDTVNLIDDEKMVNAVRAIEGIAREFNAVKPRLS
ncbi:hypothetical protein [Alkalibacterium sp.]